MPQHDLNIANASGGTFRADLNDALVALGSTMKGPNAPSAPVAGMQWVEDDNPSSSVWTWKVYDGADWSTVGTIDSNNNRVVLNGLFAAGSASAPGVAPEGDSNTGLWAPAADTLAISTGGTERLRVTSAGRVAVNTTAPWASTIVFESYTQTTGDFAVSGRQSATGGGGGALLLRTDRTDVSLGTFYFGASTIVGSITHDTTSTAYNTTSDARLKDVVGGVTGSGAIIEALEPQRFTWKANPSLGTFTSFLAQDVLTHYPEAATPGRNEPGDAGFVPAQVDLSKLVPVLWAEVRSLRARVAALEAV